MHVVKLAGNRARRAGLRDLEVIQGQSGGGLIVAYAMVGPVDVLCARDAVAAGKPA